MVVVHGAPGCSVRPGLGCEGPLPTAVRSAGPTPHLGGPFNHLQVRLSANMLFDTQVPHCHCHPLSPKLRASRNHMADTSPSGSVLPNPPPLQIFSTSSSVRATALLGPFPFPQDLRNLLLASTISRDYLKRGECIIFISYSASLR